MRGSRHRHGPDPSWAGFTTGPAARGYGLGSVELYLESPPADGLTMPLVTLHADEAGSPGELLARLGNPDSFTAGANRFWAPFSVVLDPNRTYHVVANLGADAPQAFSLVTSGKSDVPTGAPGGACRPGRGCSAATGCGVPTKITGFASRSTNPAKTTRSFRETRRRKSPASPHRNRLARRMNLPPLHRLHRLHRHRARPAQPSPPRRRRRLTYRTMTMTTTRRHRRAAPQRDAGGPGSPWRNRGNYPERVGRRSRYAAK